MNFDIYEGKRVFVTGHTGFKGSWLCEMLLMAGAEVYGYALKPPTKPALFNQLKLAKRITSHVIGDVRDLRALTKAVKAARPDFVFHLAAQPLVRLSYEKPVETFETNVMGTVNLLEAVRRWKCEGEKCEGRSAKCEGGESEGRSAKCEGGESEGRSAKCEGGESEGGSAKCEQRNVANSAVGPSSLALRTKSNLNTAVGPSSLALRTKSNLNTAVGPSPLALRTQCSVVCITTDKCYENKETTRPYREDDPMGGYDPYSCSKGCDELAIASYRRSFFNGTESPVWLASARAGNVIGGGDWALDRIVPDCMRALDRGEKIAVRNKTSTRPWQHVLEPLAGYLTLGAALAARQSYEKVAGGFNFGPDPKANRTVKDLVVEILKHRKGGWIDKSDPKAVHEAGLLNLDIRKARKVLGWKPRWDFEETIEKTVEWYEAVRKGESAAVVTQRQVVEYMGQRAL